MSTYASRFKQVPPATATIIILCIAAYIILPLIPNGAVIRDSFVISPVALMSGHVDTLITSMFLHGSLPHLLCNMVSLYYLGVMCERVYGTFRFLIIYFVSGIVGGLAFCIINYMSGDITASAVGASGAIFGLFGAYGWLLVKERKVATLMGQPTSIDDLKGFGAILLVNLGIGFLPGSNIANEAHIGGMIAGFIVGMSFYFSLPKIRLARKNRAPRTKAAKATGAKMPKMPKFQKPQVFSGGGNGNGGNNSKPAQTATQTPLKTQQQVQSQTQPQVRTVQVEPLQTSVKVPTPTQTQAKPQAQPQPKPQPKPQVWQDEGRAGQYDPYHTKK